MECDAGSIRKEAVEKPETEDNPVRVEIKVVMKAGEPTLLGLPGQIRNQIYSYVIGGHTIHCSYPVGCNVTPFKLYGLYGKERWNRLFSLSLVCRQLNHEAKNLPYELNTFMFAV
ncbi:hypothetical protein PTMSG1_01056 [Pyrenophora teres f. maculata]|nr:hypothetical protein PTMSG1_01056 [Pyrenophora teres f. maculata]